MPRQPRIHLQGAVYFVSSKGLEEQPLFIDQADYSAYTDLLAKYKAQHQFHLYAYTLLPGRLHLLIETGEEATISEIMHDLTSAYTKYFNARHKRKGHLFESRFKSVMIEKEPYLARMTRYVRHLPYTVGAEKGSAGLPAVSGGDYQFDGELADQNEIAELEKKLKRTGILGSEQFSQKAKARLVEQSKSRRAPASRRVVVSAVAVGVVALLFSVFQYAQKTEFESKYLSLLRQKDADFAEKSSFENRSPIALADLEGTLWNIELIDRSGKITKDRARFKDGRFESEFLSAKGFRQGKYFLVPQGGGLVLWQTAQASAEGGNVRWQGEWKGDFMKGSVMVDATGKESAEYSFYSSGWSYS